MNWKEEYKAVLWMIAIFVAAYFMPIQNNVFKDSILEAFALLNWYAKEHVIFCLIPAFFIAGVISVFISQGSVIKYLGARAEKWKAYLIASVSGTILAVCSCTILPLFSSIHKRGAGLGPAIAFLYSGPAINILAIILTARILGLELGIARIIGAVSFSVLIGLIMAFIYRKEEKKKLDEQNNLPVDNQNRPLWQTAAHFFILVGILIFANWGRPTESDGLWSLIYNYKWLIVAIFSFALALSLIYIVNANRILTIASSAIVVIISFFYQNPVVLFAIGTIFLTVILTFSKDEANNWLGESWSFARQILPLLAIGVLIAGFLLGSQTGKYGVIPKEWIANFIGGNSLLSNFAASFIGAFMYFATLTEIPILQGLINYGMGKGPALALLLAGPALSLPNMLVIKEVIGVKKTAIYVSLVIIFSTIVGFIYGNFF